MEGEVANAPAVPGVGEGNVPAVPGVGEGNVPAVPGAGEDNVPEAAAAGRMELGLTSDWFLGVFNLLAPVISLSLAIFIIVADQDFGSNTWCLASMVVFSTFFGIVLFPVCTLKRYPSAANCLEEDLFDVDLEIDNDTDPQPYYAWTTCWEFLCNALVRNPYAFTRFRPAYGIPLLSPAIVFCLVLVLISPLTGREVLLDDCYCAAREVLLMTAVFYVLLCFLANSGWYRVQEERDFYFPFDHVVQIPMKVMIGKTVGSFFTTNGMHVVLGLAFSSLVVVLVMANVVSEGTVLMLLPDTIPYQHNFFALVLLSCASVCAIVLFGMVLSSWIEVRRSILGTIEKNFERNMVAIDYILQDTELESLVQIKEALLQKARQELTNNEMAAYQYIGKPIWMTKPPFGGRWLLIEALSDLLREVSQDVRQEEPSNEGGEQQPQPVEAEVLQIPNPARPLASNRTSPVVTRSRTNRQESGASSSAQAADVQEADIQAANVQEADVQAANVQEADVQAEDAQAAYVPARVDRRRDAVDDISVLND